MNRLPVQPDNLKSVGYNEKERILEVEFHKGDKLYRYMGVPKQAYEGLIGSTTPGKFFAVMIKGRYVYNTVTKEDAS